jgi:hypothetical protein
MSKSKFTESQIVAILAEGESGLAVDQIDLHPVFKYRWDCHSEG